MSIREQFEKLPDLLRGLPVIKQMVAEAETAVADERTAIVQQYHAEKAQDFTHLDAARDAKKKAWEASLAKTKAAQHAYELAKMERYTVARSDAIVENLKSKLRETAPECIAAFRKELEDLYQRERNKEFETLEWQEWQGTERVTVRTCNSDAVSRRMGAILKGICDCEELCYVIPAELPARMLAIRSAIPLAKDVWNTSPPLGVVKTIASVAERAVAAVRNIGQRGNTALES